MISLLRQGLACYRLARLIAIDDGPWDIFRQLRSILGAYDYGPDGRPQSNMGRMVSCPYCTGIWVAIVFLVLPNSKVKEVLLDLLSVSGVQTFLQSTEGK